MSLWTPYAEEALDLSKSVQIKEDERISSTSSLAERRYSYEYGAANLPVREYPVALYIPPRHPSPDGYRTSWSPCPKTTLSPTNSPEFYEVDSLSDDVEYQAFERDALRAMAEKNGGTLLGNNPRMRRAVQTSQAVDDSYKKQRERNNFAAKQSRDRRKLREVRLAFQVTFLQKKLTALREKLGSKYCSRCQPCRASVYVIRQK